MNNLTCRRWANLIHKNNPKDDTFDRCIGNNQVSVSWMVNIWVNNADTSWGDNIINIENNCGIFMFDPYQCTIDYPNLGIRQYPKK